MTLLCILSRGTLTFNPFPAPPLQLAKLSEVDTALRAEYALRRRMLIERVKVTLQSFMWSPRLEAKVGFWTFPPRF